MHVLTNFGLLIAGILLLSQLCCSFDPTSGGNLVTKCPRLMKNTERKCPYGMPYENIDGACNNLVERDAGSLMSPLKRYLSAEYGDGVQSPRRSRDGEVLPSPRLISNAFDELGVDETDSEVYSHMFVQMGQFIAHDTVATPVEKELNKTEITCDCSSTRPECLTISIPPNDRIYKGTRKCIPMVRSAHVQGTSCSGKPRQQMNSITAFLDGNTIYGSSNNLFNSLMDPESDSGELLVRKDATSEKRNHQSDSIPIIGQINETLHGMFDCPSHLHGNKSTCLASGEKRANENVGLLSMHIIFTREHNRIGRQLKLINPKWSSKDIFMETRRIITAITQAITYKEFLPALVGPKLMKKYDISLLPSGYYYGYDATYDASIANVWATAAFRYGHSMVKKHMSQLNSFYEPMDEPFPMHQVLFNPKPLLNVSEHGDAFILRGLLEDAAENADTKMTEELRSKMFLSDTKIGVDLFAINTERGRDHGLPGYNKWRNFCGLKMAVNFEDLLSEIPEQKVKVLSYLYKNVNDIDLFVGGLSESPIESAAVGPTFACLNAAQFRDIKKGDRMWFENPEVFTYEQLKEIRKMTFARILCDNVVGMETVQPNTMLLDSGPGNTKISCDEIARMNLSPWKNKSLSHDDGVLTRWFPQGEGERNIHTLQKQLIKQRGHVCTGPLDYEVETYKRSDSNMYRRRIRFKCPHGTIAVSDSPHTPKGYVWTTWFDRDSPYKSAGDDNESLELLLIERPQDVCAEPIQIQTKTADKDLGIGKETLEYFNARMGLVCKKKHQPEGDCSDYAVRFLCPKEFFQARKTYEQNLMLSSNVYWTSWRSSDTPNGRGDFETPGLARFVGNSVCWKPLLIEARVTGTDVSIKETGDVLKRYSTMHGLICVNDDQSNGKCNDYEVRYLCPNKY